LTYSRKEGSIFN